MILECFIDECHLCTDQYVCLSSVLIVCFIQDKNVREETLLVVKCHIH